MPQSLPDPRQAIQSTVSAASRERVIGELTERFAHDDLTLDEFERRAAAAYAAATPAELESLLADLRRAVQPLSTVPAVPAVPAVPVQLGTVFGSLVRNGWTTVPARLEIRVMAGSVELDLSRAQFAPGVTEIVVRGVMGNVEIQLPASVDVEDDIGVALGNVEYHGRPEPGAGGAQGRSLVRFTGRVVMSNVEVTSRSTA